GPLRALYFESVRSGRAARSCLETCSADVTGGTAAVASMAKTGSWFALSGLIIVLDQLTKYAVARTFSVGEAVAVTPFFNLVLVYNRGAAFSFLSDQSGWQRALFITIAVAASVWIVYLLRKHPQQRLFALALALVLAGALGNVIDRILFGAV